MKAKNSLVVSIALALGISVTSYADTPQKSAFIIVNDDSGVLSDPARAKNSRLLLLAQLKDLNKRRQYSSAQVQVISTSYARTVWVGQVSDLRTERAAELIKKLEPEPNNCNNLTGSFSAVQTAVKQLTQQRYTDVHIYFFSSLISTPTPCSDLKITLPQLPVPVNFLETLASSEDVSSLAFFYVNPHQLRAYQEALQGVATWTNTNNKPFGLFDMESTDFQLRSGLLGVE